MNGLGDGWIGEGEGVYHKEVDGGKYGVNLYHLHDDRGEIEIYDTATDHVLVRLEFKTIEEAITAANAIIAGRGVK